MARRSTGGVVIDTRRKSPVFALRFRASGRRQFVTLGSADEGWTRKKAEDALRHTLSDVERGIWRPPDREPAPAPVTSPDPLFHEFATRWYADNEPGWEEKTRLDYSWQLSRHLLPAFATFRLSQIDAAAIDRYKAAKLREGRLGPTSINKTITRLAQILEVACEYGLVDKNPAKGRHRKVKASEACARVARPSRAPSGAAATRLASSTSGLVEVAGIYRDRRCCRRSCSPA